MSKEKKLTDKEQRFVQEFLVDLNRTKAAERAGYSDKSARQIGSELMAKPHVQDAVEQALAARSARTQVSADRVIRELAKVGFVNMKDLATWEDGRPALRDSGDIAEEDAAAIKSFSYSSSSGETNSESFSFQTHDKVRALELLGKHLKLFVDRVEHDITVGLAEKLESARQRAAQSAPASSSEGGADE